MSMTAMIPLLATEIVHLDDTTGYRWILSDAERAHIASMFKTNSEGKKAWGFQNRHKANNPQPRPSPSAATSWAKSVGSVPAVASTLFLMIWCKMLWR
jgi:hypothetical protein